MALNEIYLEIFGFYGFPSQKGSWPLVYTNWSSTRTLEMREDKRIFIRIFKSQTLSKERGKNAYWLFLPSWSLTLLKEAST